MLPHPERTTPAWPRWSATRRSSGSPSKSATRHEKARGWQVESVEADNRGFDLISRRPHPEDPKTFIEVRFIEVKGRAGVGEIALTDNEYKTAERLKGDYWLYVVFNCGEHAGVAYDPGPGHGLAGCRWSRSSTITSIRGRSSRPIRRAATRRRVGKVVMVVAVAQHAERPRGWILMISPRIRAPQGWVAHATDKSVNPDDTSPMRQRVRARAGAVG